MSGTKQLINKTRAIYCWFQCQVMMSLIHIAAPTQAASMATSPSHATIIQPTP